MYMNLTYWDTRYEKEVTVICAWAQFKGNTVEFASSGHLYTLPIEHLRSIEPRA